VVNVFQQARGEVAWNLRNRWRNALAMFKQLNGMMSHIFREGNQVADSLANVGCTLSSPMYWNQSPDFISNLLEKNKFGHPSFRIC
jgi:hypothetical protein